jgi:hypothetical protein
MFEVYGDLVGGRTFVLRRRFASESDARTFMDAHCATGNLPVVIGYNIRPVAEQ